MCADMCAGMPSACKRHSQGTVAPGGTFLLRWKGYVVMADVDGCGRGGCGRMWMWADVDGCGRMWMWADVVRAAVTASCIAGHVYTHVCAHVYTHVCTHVYTHVSTHVYNVYIHVYTHVHTQVPYPRHEPRARHDHRSRRIALLARAGIDTHISTHISTHMSTRRCLIPLQQQALAAARGPTPDELNSLVAHFLPLPLPPVRRRPAAVNTTGNQTY